MKEEIIIGKDGQQPFKVTGRLVSRKHCKITIEDGMWVLTDLDSSNGTFIRDKKTGRLLPVTEQVIDPMTFICLADDTPEGCTFYADSVFHPDKYSDMFAYISDVDDQFDEEEKRLEKRVRQQKIILFVLNAALIVASFLPIFDKCPDLRLNLLRIVPLVSTGLTAFYDAQTKKKKLEERRNRFRHCPNPECSHILRVKDIHAGQCPKCKASVFNK